MMKIEVITKPTWDDLIQHTEKSVKETEETLEEMRSNLQYWKEMKYSGQPVPKELESQIRELISG